MKTMNSEQITAWLQANRPYLNLTAIGKEAGIPAATITRAVKGEKDAQGYPIRLPPDKLPALAAIIAKIRQ